MYYDDLYINLEGHLEVLGTYHGNTGETRPRTGIVSKLHADLKTNRVMLIIMLLFFHAIDSQPRQLRGQTFKMTNNYKNTETLNT